MKDVDIPRDALVVFTGVSGSGKSSLAFGTLYAEAQRRYLESVAPYARRLDQGFVMAELHFPRVRSGEDRPDQGAGARRAQRCDRDPDPASRSGRTERSRRPPTGMTALQGSR